jgi:predicted nucleotidyltransferase
MPAAGLDDLILKRFRAAVDEIYGDRIERVVLFGSRARGDAREDSDYDIAVFLHDLTDYWREADRIADIGVDILHDTGAVINGLIFPAGAYQARTVFMNEVRLDGLDL